MKLRYYTFDKTATTAELFEIFLNNVVVKETGKILDIQVFEHPYTQLFFIQVLSDPAIKADQTFYLKGPNRLSEMEESLGSLVETILTEHNRKVVAVRTVPLIKSNRVLAVVLTEKVDESTAERKLGQVEKTEKRKQNKKTDAQ